MSLGPFSLLTSHKDLSLDLGYTLIQDGFPDGAEVKASACNAGDLGSIPGQEDPPEKEVATHSSILAWRIPWWEEPGRLQSTGLQSET